jgi:hypothetical protein
MVIIKVMGGLGNQMFQFAMGKSIELQKGYRVKYDLTYYDRIPEGDTPRKPYIASFCGESSVATEAEIRQINGKTQNYAVRLLHKIMRQESRSIEENKENPTRDFLDTIEDGQYLIGYWQNECYFKDIEDTIRRTFDFSGRKLDNLSKKRMEEIKAAKSSTSIHVRAGDYLSGQNRTIFGDICTSDYYRKACDYILERYPETVFFLFTNDVAWTKANIDLPYGQTVIVSPETDAYEDWVDMFLMSSCKHNIIANSSYSWWGGWLNKNPQKIVVCPDRWKNGDCTNRIACKEWIKIS